MEIAKLNDIVSELSQEEVLEIIKTEENSDYLYLWYLLIYGQVEECCELFTGDLQPLYDLNLILNILKCLDRYTKFEKYKKILLDHISDDIRSMTDNQREIYESLKSKFFSDKRCSVIVACMNREENLLKSLPSWFDNEYIHEIILVDYSSTDKLSDNEDIQHWIRDGYVTLVRVEDEEYFSLGKAYNLGIDHASGDFLIKIDADYVLKDASFLDKFLTSPRVSSEYFIRGDYNFGMSMSGFFMIATEHFVPYREDLNGYGYDEIDLYNRISDHNPKIREIIFFDIENYIYHIPHNNKQRVGNYAIKNTVLAEQNNRNLCEIKSFTIPPRLGYKKDGNIIKYNGQTLDKIFCISLKDKKDRRKYLSGLDFIDMFDAVDTRKNKNIYHDFGLSYHPVNKTHDLYFKASNGAFGAYLSHFCLWKHIVANDIQYSLILEDDIKKENIIELLNSNIIFEPFEIVNLSKRTRWCDRTIFDGAEAYILSRSGAEKLLRATYLPRTLNSVIPECYYKIDELAKSEKIKDRIEWASYPAITCPLDKFIGYCCETNADNLVRLNSNLYPFIELNTGLAINSDINSNDDIPPWEWTSHKMLKYIS